MEFLSKPVSDAKFTVGHLIGIIVGVGLVFWLIDTFAVKRNVVTYSDGTTGIVPSFLTRLDSKAVTELKAADAKKAEAKKGD